MTGPISNDTKRETNLKRLGEIELSIYNAKAVCNIDLINELIQEKNDLLFKLSQSM